MVKSNPYRSKKSRYNNSVKSVKSKKEEGFNTYSRSSPYGREKSKSKSIYNN